MSAIEAVGARADRVIARVMAADGDVALFGHGHALRILTARWALFFLAMAVLNEIIWRTQSTDFWVNFKVFGIMPLTLVFSALQMPVILKHQIPEETAQAD